MTCCTDMEVGQIYTCEDCGLELQVVKGCSDDEGVCSDEECTFVCCGGELVLKG